ncbi:u3 small nucleolar RNA-associated protein 11 [Punctularia strigosozonata HHB-11173 SS5]|uniref:u3 small nucleolar RNA-associated protein 11 n=1 Tax=Punctularia strigosozonata (strain HHB-11173) TaxID=741275 RepID=UPI00044165D3|nr:u3 small nucleolar RNA-associated protein 11 [Punctularia strigosozonata HHB-11173 SS5]EIN14012.1 u3 small nucleolar RNA-associated protein 11 [Punctularia strigosozonata HHB-11173 SS5]
MSSLRNSLHRRNHKERSQLAHRTRFGILEKHKDYVLRARDYHSKQDRLKRLQQKAADRNKDEFYFGMTRQRTENGVHVQERGNVALPIDLVKVLKTQDANYIRTMRLVGLKKIDKLKAELSALADLLRPISSVDHNDAHGLDEEEIGILEDAGILSCRLTKSRRRKSGPGHTVFADSVEEAPQGSVSLPSRTTNESDVVTDTAVDLGWKTPERGLMQKKRRRLGNELSNASVGAEEPSGQAREHRSRLLKELSARLKREQQLRYAERELDMQKMLMGKGARRKIAGVEKVEGESEDENADEDTSGKKRGKVDGKTYKPRVYKWRAERKR